MFNSGSNVEITPKADLLDLLVSISNVHQVFNPFSDAASQERIEVGL